jgi:hypothetical protein
MGGPRGGAPRGGGSGVLGPPGGMLGAMGPQYGGMGVLGQRPTDEEEDQNLVELAVYGIASLYERFPPKTATPDAAANPTAAPAK